MTRKHKVPHLYSDADEFGMTKQEENVLGKSQARDRAKTRAALRDLGVRVEHTFALSGPDAQRVFVEQLFVGFKKIYEKSGGQ